MRRPAVLVILAAIGCGGREYATLDGSRVRLDGGAVPTEDAQLAPPGRPDGGPVLPRADREIVLPYLGPEAIEELQIDQQVGSLDVFFSIDTTGSFGGEIDNLQSELRGRVIPTLRERIDDVAFGVGRFEDFPVEPWGATGDRPFRLLTAITTDEARLASAVARLDQPLGDGGDIPESGAEALFQIATGEGYADLVAPFTSAAPGGGEVGGGGFRSESLRVVVHATDAPSHGPADYVLRFAETHSIGDAIDALSREGIRVIGVASGADARPMLEAVAIGTGAVAPADGGSCATGIDGRARPSSGGACPLVFDVRADGSGLATAIVDSISELLDALRYEEVWGESDDELGLVRGIEALEASVDGTPIERADRRPSDGLPDTYVAVPTGARLTFRARLRNETILPADYDQIFHVTIRVVGDGLVLASRRLRIVVPRGRLDAGAPDAGAPAPPTDGG